LLKRKEFIISLTIVFTVLTGIFIFVPAVAVQKQDSDHGVEGDRNSNEASSVDVGMDIQDIMKELEARERELSKREEALKKEEARLDMLKNSIELSLKQYSSLREKMQKSPSDSKTRDGVSMTAKLYEAMSVEEAAQRIEKMDTELSVKLLSAIKSKQAGKILGAISADKAALISERIVSKKVEK